MKDILKIACQYTNDLSWQRPTDAIFEIDEQIHFWLFKTTDYQAKDLLLLEELLNTEEKARAYRFRFEKDKKRYIITHGVLRQLLAKYLNVAPQEIEFGKGEHHKPMLVSPAANLLFNISHSGEAIAIGILNQNRVSSEQIDFGVDIEQFKNNRDHRLIAKYYFSERERLYLNQDASHRQFYVYWTRKEALLKASGIGLLGDIQQLEVAEKEQKIAIENSDWSVFANKDYRVLTFLIEKDLMGSIALSGFFTDEFIKAIYLRKP